MSDPHQPAPYSADKTGVKTRSRGTYSDYGPTPQTTRQCTAIEPFVQKTFVDSGYDSYVIFGEPNPTRCDFGNATSSALGLDAITVRNRPDETGLDLLCSFDKTRAAEAGDIAAAFLTKRGEQISVETAADIQLAGPPNEHPHWREPVFPAGGISHVSLAGTQVMFRVTDENLQRTGIAGGLREFVEALSLPKSTKLQVMDSIARAREALNERR